MIGILKAEEVFRHGHRHQQAVHAIADAELAFLGFEVDVGGLVGDGLADDIGNRGGPAASSFHICLVMLRRFRCDIIVVTAFERAGADAEMLG